MSAVATRERGSATAGPLRPGEPAAPLFDDGVTLEDVVLGAWDELVVEGTTHCPVCSGTLTAAGCEDCGSELS